MRKTKIICTIGPACESEETLRQMFLAGMNVARLNFSHGDHAEHLARIETIKRLREELNLPIAIMLDTKGPEYRIRTFQNGSVTLREGDEFTFTTDEIIGDEHRVSVSYKGLMQDLVPGDKILLSNGLLSFSVKSVSGTDAVCTVVNGGVLGDRKNTRSSVRCSASPTSASRTGKISSLASSRGSISSPVPSSPAARTCWISRPF